MGMSQKTADGIFVQCDCHAAAGQMSGGENLRTMMVTSMFWKPAA